MNHGACEEFRELVSDFVDDRLEAADLLRVERHLASCPGCRDFDARVRGLRDLLRAGEGLRPLARPSPAFSASVMQRVREEAAAPRPQTVAAPWWLPLWSRAGMALAAALAAVVFAWSWQRLLRPPAAPIVVARPAAEEGSMETYLSRHTLLARDATLLGPAEEVEFASFHTAGPR